MLKATELLVFSNIPSKLILSNIVSFWKTTASIMTYAWLVKYMPKIMHTRFMLPCIFCKVGTSWFCPCMLEGYSTSTRTIVASLISGFMGPTWGPSGADRTQVSPMLAPWTLLSGIAQVPVKQLKRPVASFTQEVKLRLAKCPLVNFLSKRGHRGKYMKCMHKSCWDTGLILGLCPANERRCYKVTPSLIGWAQT